MRTLLAKISIGAELLGFLWQARLWWMIPMVFLLLLFGVILIAQSSAIAPFIYTLF